MIKIVPSTAEHIKAMYGATHGVTVRAVSAVEDGQVIGIGGVYKSNGNTVAFLRLSDRMRSNPKTLLKSVREFLSKIEGPIFANCDTKIEAAPRFLSHLGFVNIKGDLWLIQ